MKNRRIIVSTVELNAATTNALAVEIDGTYDETITAINGNKVITRFPKELQIINETGTEIEVLILANAEEYAEYLVTPSIYQFVRLQNSSTMQDSINLVSVYKMLISKNTFGTQGTAAADLCVELMGYR